MKIESCCVNCNGEKLKVFNSDKPIIHKSPKESEESIRFLLDCIQEFFKDSLFNLKDIRIVQPLSGCFYDVVVDTYDQEKYKFSLGLRN